MRPHGKIQNHWIFESACFHVKQISLAIDPLCIECKEAGIFETYFSFIFFMVLIVNKVMTKVKLICPFRMSSSKSPALIPKDSPLFLSKMIGRGDIDLSADKYKRAKHG